MLSLARILVRTFGVLGVLSATAAARPPVLHPDHGIPDHYIVMLRGGGDAAIDRVAGAHGLRLDHRYTYALLGFAARMTQEQAARLADDPDVELVEQDELAEATEMHVNPAWGLDRIDQVALPLDARYAELGDGAGVNIYVIDTGIRYSHAEFANRVLPGAYAVQDGNLANDCNGHGSHVAGITAGSTYGVARHATIVPVRVLGCDGNGQIADIVAGINWVIANHGPSSIANMSLGVAGGNDMVDTAVRNMVAAGITVVVAAGNATTDACTFSPARVREVITVGASSESDARAVFSNYGPCVDISAPGTNILSVSIASDTATTTLSGTSMASPHVAGAAAAYLGAHPGATPAQVMSALLVGGNANKMFDTMGSPNLLLNTAFIDTAPPTLAITQPTSGQVLPPGFLVQTAAADPNLAAVDLALDGLTIDTAVASPFDFELTDVASGPHTLTVTATDLAGHATVQTVAITVFHQAATSGGDDGSTGGCSTTTSSASALPLVALALLYRRRRRSAAKPSDSKTGTNEP